MITANAKKAITIKPVRITLRVAWRGDSASESHQLVQKRKSNRQIPCPMCLTPLSPTEVMQAK